MKKRVGLIFGGKSAEHEVSLQSAKNVLEAIDKDKYEVLLIGIDKEGKWHMHDSSHFLLNAEDPKLIALNKTNEGVAFVPGETQNKLVKTDGKSALGELDVIFPILHGTLGEDGSIQGMLRVAEIPFVGSSVLGSAVSMDKDIAKRLLRVAGLKVADSYTFTRATRENISFEDIEKSLGLPLFIKPANQGSSVGVSKVESKEEFNAAVTEAFKYDHKILIEEAIRGREIECSILGNEYPKASIPGEIIAVNDFYSYEAKYIDEHGATLQIPAELNEKQVKEIQDVAIQAFQALNCEGMARVDVFLTEADEIIINEINTIPGFTKISMYPKLWEHSGISYSDLIDQLIQLAIERHERDSALESSFEAE
ncbi:D-alanine--D-alanine ligase [Oceanobacillus luteolus]|uniref:D-alanine--D-alanine ligase n=1 Tax=Oceanobacillus luteolus TaxID=1274358 RepID=A0ABW4HN99_9BACI|nr:D-alanine--D-alanine ligase [Oceanobacillus luteolus]MCM3740482.1 D-alanine--D-alanine ligase [Oceanobacillus luteolus]